MISNTFYVSALGATDLPILEQRNTWARRAANTGGSHHGRLHHTPALASALTPRAQMAWMSRTSALLRCTSVAAMAIHPRFEVHQRTFRSSSDVEKDLLRHNAAHQASTARKFGRRLREFSRSAASAGHIETAPCAIRRCGWNTSRLCASIKVPTVLLMVVIVHLHVQ